MPVTIHDMNLSAVSNMALLGILSLKHGKSLEWDGVKEQIVGDPAANKLLRREYRNGYEYPAR